MGKAEQAAVVGVTEQRVLELIGEAIKGLDEGVKLLIVDLNKTTAEQIAEAVKGLVTGEQVKCATDIIDGILIRIQTDLEKLNEGAMDEDDVVALLQDLGISARIPASLQVTTEDMPPVDPKWLKGLKFRTSRQGKDKAHQVVERDLVPSDVLDWTTAEDGIRIVTTDGQKYTVQV